MRRSPATRDRADYDYAHHGCAGNPSTDFVPDDEFRRWWNGARA